MFVWQHGGDFLIGFRGELHGVAVGLTVTPTNSPAGATATDLARMDGINYYGFATNELLTILLGAGDDRFNVRGTLPHTVLDSRRRRRPRLRLRRRRPGRVRRPQPRAAGPRPRSCCTTRSSTAPSPSTT